MDKIPFLIHEKKRKIDIDFKLCFICQKYPKSKIIIKAATWESLDKALNNIKERFKSKDASVPQLVERLGDNNLQDIVNNNGFYHRQCYQDITNKETPKIAEKRLNKAISLAIPPASKPKWGRASLKNLTEEKEERVTRSQSVPYEESQCIILSKNRWTASWSRDERNWSENARSLAKTIRQREGGIGG